jgi:hypothetical protein
MTNQSSEQLFRQAAEEEGGISVSAGARIAHVRLALQSGRAVMVDLAQVPEERRGALVAVIQEIVRLSSRDAARPGPAPTTSRSEPAAG